MTQELCGTSRGRLGGRPVLLLACMLLLLVASMPVLFSSGEKPKPTTAAAAAAAESEPRRTRGLAYTPDMREEIPWSIHLLKIDRSRTDYQFHTTLARSTGFGLSKLSDQIKSLPREWGQPLAAVNGDFWKDGRQFEGDPMGLQVKEGELVSGPCARPCFWIDTKGQPHATNVIAHFQFTTPEGLTGTFGVNEERTNNGAVLFTPTFGTSTHTKGGRELVLEHAPVTDIHSEWPPLAPGKEYTVRIREVREKGDTSLAHDQWVLSLCPEWMERFSKLSAGAILKLSTATTPDLLGVQTALGGGPMLVRDGKAIAFNGSQPRHPRTALGWNTNYYFLVVVDGRQSNLSVGMTLPELADYLVTKGCTDAINLDGGGSSTFWVRGQVMNSPCNGGEREMANSLVLVQKPKSTGTPQNTDPP